MKVSHLRTGFVLLPGIIMLFLAGCAASTPSPRPPYIHYAPSKFSTIRLEFDYPGSWTFSEEKIQGTDFILIGMGDPRFINVPTRAPNESHGTPSDFGSVHIIIEPVEYQTLNSRVEGYKQGHSDSSWVIPLNEYETKVDGYEAVVLEYQIEPLGDNGYTSLMFERDVFFAIKDKTYQIVFTVAEHERGGEFEKGYEYFFDSLKIAP